MNSKKFIFRLIQLKPNIPTFHLAKLLYLYDLAFIQLEGKPKTGLPWIWHLFGPYCEEIPKNIWELKKDGKIEINYYISKKYNECYLHTPIEKKPVELETKEEYVLKYIVDNYADWKTDELKEFVYNTPPMREAQEKKADFKPLNLFSKKDLPNIFYDPDISKMILKSKLKLRKRNPVTLAKAWEKLEKKCVKSC